MKTFKSTKLAAIAITLASTFAASGAFADYRVSAFSDTFGFRALLNQDLTEVETMFTSRKIERMDYFEANNLCVAEILLEKYEDAITSCNSALEKSEYSSELTVEDENIALAAIYSNLAIAKVMSGDTVGANIDLETALSLNQKDGNANINYDLISTTLVAGS